MTDELIVKIGGQAVEGWTGVRVTRGIERLPSGIALDFTELYPGQASSPAVVTPGLEATVYLGSDLVLTGYANLYWPHEDAGTHVVRAELRSKTQDLVDCSLAPPAALPPWMIHAASFKAVAEQLCKPFGIEVSMPDGEASLLMSPSGSHIPPFVINPGETVAELLEYMARTVQMLMYDDERGRLVLAKVHSTRAGSLVEGVNCEVAEARISDDQRFSQIYVVGQAAAPGSVPHVLNIFGSAKDDGVKRYRPKLIVMDAPGPDMKFAQQRANWEKARRIGRSLIVDVTVTGWRDGTGKLWAPNTIARCTIPSLKVERDLLISEVAWMLSEAGTSTLLTLMPPEGFIPEPFFFDPLPGYQAPLTAAELSGQQPFAGQP